MTNLMKSVVAAMLVTASVAQAVEVSGQAASVAAQSRELQLQVLNSTQKALAGRIGDAMVQAEALGTAKEQEKSYLLNITELSKSKNVGFWTMLGSAALSYGFEATPLSKYASQAAKPTWVVLAISGLAWAGGWYYQGENQKALLLSKKTYAVAVKKLEITEAQLKNDREVIMAQATSLGVRVDAKIVAFDGLEKLQGLRSLGGGALNVNQD